MVKSTFKLTAAAAAIAALSACNVVEPDAAADSAAIGGGSSNSGSVPANFTAVDITNFDAMLTYSNNIAVDDQNTEYYSDDSTRLKRGDNTAQEIEYLVNGDIKNIKLVTYYDKKVADSSSFEIFLSKTGENYKAFAVVQAATGVSSDWVNQMETNLENIPAGYDFIKIVFPVLEGNDELPWNPQLGDVFFDVTENTAHAADNVRGLGGNIGPVAGGQAPLAVPPEVADATYNQFDYYVTRGLGAEGNKLFDGSSEFRFVSFNTPELFMQESPFWRPIDPFETEDTLKSIAAMGGKVTRSYVLSVKNSNNPDGPFHITFGSNNELQFNEDLFADLDLALDLANKHGVRIILPLIDNWSWWGGMSEYAANRGKTKAEFFTDPQLKADYKTIVDYVLNRTNTISGIKYKDDPAIFAWETGNELPSVPSAWTTEMAAYIKSIDANHLVMDGSFDGISEVAIADTNVDIISNHYYGTGSQASGDYTARFLADWNMTKNSKPFIVGETGLSGIDTINAVIQSVIDQGATGIMLWSLRPQDAQGGYLNKKEDNVVYHAYHWPGFAENDSYEELALINSVWAKAYEINAETKPELPAPNGTPVMLPVTSAADIRWQGVTNAQYYDVERCDQANDCSAEVNWIVVGNDIVTGGTDASNYMQVSVTDNSTGVEVVHENVSIQKLFSDLTVGVNTTYSYRVKAFNKTSTGLEQESVYSNLVSFTNVAAPDLYLEDHYTDLSKVYYMDEWATANLVAETGNSFNFAGDDNRVKRKEDQANALTYQLANDIQSIVLDTYFDNGNAGTANFTVQLSVDGSSYDNQVLNSTITDGGGEYYFKKVAYTAAVDESQGYRYMKIIFPATGDGKPWAPQLGYLKVDIKD
ncbi:hypothetical protein [Psychromonas aquimarina]|uniref:hypothetical protein n=1 Tax=Psychromonas aquimarina TaxID=444919 RepID=UPI00041D8F01|nr:hypothetical protein [Psychromonas aquimarina]